MSTAAPIASTSSAPLQAPASLPLVSAPPVEPSARAAAGLLAFGLMAAVWIAYFPLPILEYYKEWVYAMTLALAAWACPVAPWSRGRGAPAEILLVLGLLMLLLLQALTGDGLWPRAVMIVGYLLLFVVAHTLGGQLSAAVSPNRLLAPVCLTVLWVCLINGFFTAAQIHEWQSDWPLFMGRNGPRVGGNTAQVNHTATLLWMGIVSTAGLRVAGVIGRPTALAALLLMCALEVATGSRMPLVMAGCAVLFGLLLWRSAKDGSVRHFGGLLAFSGAALPLVDLAWTLAGVPDVLQLTSGTQRAGDDQGADSSEVRRWLIGAAWEAMRTHPWNGIGVGRFAHHTYELAQSIGRTHPHSPETNAHNLALHLGAELGVPAALGVLATVIAVSWRAWRVALKSLAGAVLGGFLMLLLIHSALEFPLWYAYFLGTAGLVLGALCQYARCDKPAVAAEPVWADQGGLFRRSLGLRAGGLALLLACLVSYRLYSPLERAMQEIVFQVSMGAVIQNNDAIRAHLAESPPWSPYRDFAETADLIATLPSQSNAAALSKACDRLIRFGPTAYLTSRCAVSYQLDGQFRRATEMATSQCTFYPGTESLIYQMLSVISQTTPEVMELKAPCLMEFTRIDDPAAQEGS